MEETDYDFHIINSYYEKEFNLLEKWSTHYKINNEEIKLITTKGDLTMHLLLCKKWEKTLSKEIIYRRLTWFEQIGIEAEKKKDYEVSKIANELVSKYKPEKKELDVTDLISEFEKNKTIRGQTAYTGIVKGEVLLIKNPDKPDKFESGRILVSKLTGPKLISQINKSIAVITDEGGILSHASIYCREAKIPCIVGTKIATQVLKNGDMIEIDAAKGIIKKINK